MSESKSKKDVISNIVNPLNVADFPIEDWKAKHTKVKLITVEDSLKKRHQFIIGRPTLSQMDMIMKYVGDSKPHKYREVMRNSCVLAGDKVVLDGDDDVRNTVFEKITEMFEKLETEEKEL